MLAGFKSRWVMPLRCAASCVQDLICQHQRLIEGDWPGQLHALDILHDQVIGADVIKRADMRMIESGRGVSLALKALAEAFLAGFNRYEPIQACIAGLPYLPHTPPRQSVQGFRKDRFCRRRTAAWRSFISV
jgi:hypothetical protein